jgi:hypothetical protein
MMTCPYCGLQAPPRQLHAHLAEAHPEGVAFVERGSRRFYALDCPICHAGYEQAIKPGVGDPAILVELEREIRLVGFDMLVNHLLGEHTPGTEEEPAPPASERSPSG